MVNDLQIAWVNDVIHLGNYIKKSLSDKLDCQQKVSTFIGSGNKLNANFRNLQHDVIARLFKSYCCAFYGSQAWRIDSPDYKRICMSWNKSVRNILRLQYSWAIVGTASYSLSTATTHLTFFVFNTE